MRPFARSIGRLAFASLFVEELFFTIKKHTVKEDVIVCRRICPLYQNGYHILNEFFYPRDVFLACIGLFQSSVEKEARVPLASESFSLSFIVCIGKLLSSIGTFI